MDKTIIGRLKGIQVRERLSDSEMANRLGCSRQLYQGTRTGKTPLGNTILRGITPAFPELQKDVIVFLSRDANNRPEVANESLKPSSEPQSGGLKRFCRDLLWRIKKGLI